MSYRSYTTPSAFGAADGHQEDTANQQSGSYGFGTTKHKRMMGRIKAKPPQRMNIASLSSSSSACTPGPSTLLAGGPHSGSAFKPARPVPFMLTPTTDVLSRAQQSDSSQPGLLPVPFCRDEELLSHEASWTQPSTSPGLSARSKGNGFSHAPPSPPVLRSVPHSMARTRPSAQEEQPSPIAEEAISDSSQQSCSSGSARAPSDDGKVLYVNGHRYTSSKKIGKGGSSVVYQVLDEERNLRAIKCVELSDADETQARGYINEIHLLEQLQGHDRIIRLFEYEHRASDDLLYVVMERGDTDLATLLKKKSSISDVQRRFYWAEMLEAVQVIHSAGVIHSDLKPANFLMVEGNLKLIDFGIATSVQSDKTSVFKDNQFGTFNFMSPEALKDLNTDDEDEEDDGSHKPRIKISFKTDVWSLGVILYYITYQRLPFGDFKMPWKKLEAIVDPNYAIKYPYCSDPLLVDTIKRCLVRDPAQRASVQELLAHDYLKGKFQKREYTGKEKLSIVLGELDNLNVLTPNTKLGISRALKKLQKPASDDT